MPMMISSLAASMRRRVTAYVESGEAYAMKSLAIENSGTLVFVYGFSVQFRGTSSRVAVSGSGSVSALVTRRGTWLGAPLRLFEFEACRRAGDQGHGHGLAAGLDR